GHPDKAAEYAAKACELVSPSVKVLGTEAHLLLAAARALRGEQQEAREALRTARQWLEQISPPRQAAEGWRTFAEVLSALDDHEGSAEAYGKAMACAGV